MEVDREGRVGNMDFLDKRSFPLIENKQMKNNRTRSVLDFCLVGKIMSDEQVLFQTLEWVGQRNNRVLTSEDRSMWICHVQNFPPHRRHFL